MPHVSGHALAALQNRALASIRAIQEEMHPAALTWRKPPLAGRSALTPGAGTTGRRRHGQSTNQRPPAPAGPAVSAASRSIDSPSVGTEPGDGEAWLDDMPPATELETPAEPLRATPSGLDDSALCALIARIAGHQDKALAALYDATAARVFGLVSRIVQDNALAEEVVEDTYWQVWRQAVRFDVGRGRPVTWLLAMARSRAIDALRRRERRPLQPLADEEEAGLYDESAAGPLDLLSATRGQHLLYSALAGLDPQPRQLVALAFLRGLTHDEVAESTGLPLGTVKSQIRRALQSLKGALESAGCTSMPW